MLAELVSTVYFMDSYIWLPRLTSPRGSSATCKTEFVEAAPRRGKIVAAILLGTSAWLAGAHLVVGDTYCGTVFYDSNRHGACGQRLATQGLFVVLATLLSLSALVVALLAGVSRRVVLQRIAVMVVVVLALTFALVAANRALEPTHGAWCGSVLNRHRTYEPTIEKRCDEILRPNTREAVLASIGSVIAAGVALLMGVRQGRRAVASEVSARPLS